eukprot:COSAG01_NODE_1517_length_10050_cov_2.477640_3_plen_91_part_00
MTPKGKVSLAAQFFRHSLRLGAVEEAATRPPLTAHTEEEAKLMAMHSRQRDAALMTRAEFVDDLPPVGLRLLEVGVPCFPPQFRAVTRPW